MVNWLFTTLCTANHVLSTHFFGYWQVFHAFGSQFSRLPIIFSSSNLENVLWSDCSTKPTSTLYSHLCMVTLKNMPSLWQRWLTFQISNIWDFPLKQLVSLRDRLIQFKIVHRAFFYSLQSPENWPKYLPELLEVLPFPWKLYSHLLVLSCHCSVLGISPSVYSFSLWGDPPQAYDY